MRNIIKHLLLILSMAIVLLLYMATIVSAYNEFTEDFKNAECEYTGEESGQYIQLEKGISKPFASTQNGTWTTSGVLFGYPNADNDALSRAYIRKNDGSIRVQGRYQANMAVNFEPAEKIKFDNITKVSFKLTSVSKATGLNLFIDDDEQNYMFFGCTNNSMWGADAKKPAVWTVVNGTRAVAKQAAATFAGVTGTWDITLENGVYSWTFTSDNGEVWKDSWKASNEKFASPEWKYLFAAFSNGDSYGGIKNISFKTGDYYSGGLGEPKNVLYADAAEGQIQDENNVLEFSGENAARIRRVFATDLNEMPLANQSVELSKDGETWDTITLDENGWWLNLENDNEYKYIKTADMCSLICALTDVGEDDTVVVHKGSFRMLYYFEDGEIVITYPTEITDTDLISVNDSMVTGLREGTVKVSLKINDIVLTTNIKVEGAYSEALKENTPEKWAKYYDTQQKIIDELNKAIDNDSIVDVSQFFEYTDDTSKKAFCNIDLIKTKETRRLSGESFVDFVQRIMSYGANFSAKSAEEIKDFENLVIKEVRTGYFNKLVGFEHFKNMIKEHNDIVGIDVDSVYVSDVYETAVNSLVGKEFTNNSDLLAQFDESVVMENVKKSINPAYICQMAEYYADIIKYNGEHFNSIKDKSNFGKKLVSIRNTINNIDDLKQFIDSYKDEEGTIKNNTENNSGGGGGGGRGGTAALQPPAMPIKSSAENTDSKITPIVEKTQLFNDVPTDHWAYEDIRYLVAKNAVSGYESGEFKPNNKISRAEFVRILLSAFDIEIEPEKSEKNEGNSEGRSKETDDTSEEKVDLIFSDVNENDWFYKYIIKGAELNLIKGDGEKVYPNNPITRQEIAVIISRMVAIKGKKLETGNKIKIFVDENSISDWAVADVLKLQAAGIVSGDDEGNFNPLSAATRAEGARMISQTIFKGIKDEEQHVGGGIE